jgi:hypothetical protein
MSGSASIIFDLSISLLGGLVVRRRVAAVLAAFALAMAAAVPQIVAGESKAERPVAQGCDWCIPPAK